MKGKSKTKLQMALCALCASCACVAMAETVQQDSRSKYYFTVPKHPEGIMGKVLGDPPAYHAMRSEDIAWIREAVAERNALARTREPGYFENERILVPEFGKWPMSATNGYVKWTTAVTLENGAITTNVTARYTWKTNDMSGSVWRIGKKKIIDKNIYLNKAYFLPRNEDGTYAESIRRGDVQGWYLTTDDNEWAETAVHEAPPWKQSESGTMMSQGEGFVAVTNVTESVTTNWTGRYLDGNGVLRYSVRTNESYITMPMANGRTSVYTNRWVEILPREERSYVTNEMWQTQYAMMFTNGIVVPYDPKVPGNLEGPFRASWVKEWYDALSGAKRCAYATSMSREDTNNVCTRIISYETVFNEQHSETNETYGAWGNRSIEGSNRTTKNFEVEYEAQMTGRNEYGEEIWEWVETGTHIETESGGGTDSEYKPEQKKSTYTLVTDMLYDMVHTGGVERIEKAWAYAWTEVSWRRVWTVSEGFDREEGSTNKSCWVMMKLGEVQEKQGGYEKANNTVGSYWFGTTNRFVAFEANINLGTVYSRAIGLAGMSFPTGTGFRPALERKCPTPTREVSSAGSYVTEKYNVGGMWIIIVVDFKPWTSLPGW